MWKKWLWVGRWGSEEQRRYLSGWEKCTFWGLASRSKAEGRYKPGEWKLPVELSSAETAGTDL